MTEQYLTLIFDEAGRIIESTSLPPDSRWVQRRGPQSLVASATDTVSAEPAADKLAPRTQRAYEEAMDVTLLKKGGVYEVHAASGNFYAVDVVAKTCTCLDWQRREPEGGCKHMRRVDIEIKTGRIPRPDGRLPNAEPQQQQNTN